MKRYTALGTGLIAATLGAIAQPANAFVITNTSATWDNVTLTTGDVVGSDGILPDSDNLVKFIDVGDSNQVRWGDAVYGGYWEDNWEQVTVEEEVKKSRRVPKRKRNGQVKRKRNGQIKYETEYYYETVTTTEWVNNPTWVPPTYEYQSGLGYEGVSDLNIETGEIFNIGTLTHFNQTIWSHAGTNAEFSLDLDFGDSAVGSQTFNFAFSIDETVNDQEVCPYHTNAGKGCSDQITWDFAIDEASSFTHEGEEYSLELVGFADQLATGGLINEFVSQEKADNSASLFARLVKVDESQDIPEPATLLGLAGLGLYVARSRKQRAREATAQVD